MNELRYDSSYGTTDMFINFLAANCSNCKNSYHQ